MEHLPDLIVPSSLENPTFYGARALVLRNMLGNHGEDPRQAAKQTKTKSGYQAKQRTFV
jgi:hypothetical protein